MKTKINGNNIDIDADRLRIMKTKEYLECKFTEDEMRTIAKQLAHENRNLEEIEAKKKTVNTDFANQIQFSKTSISSLSNKINNGYEFRDVECVTKFNCPNSGKKTITRMDTGENIDIQDMTAAEMQEPLFAEEGE